MLPCWTIELLDYDRGRKTSIKLTDILTRILCIFCLFGVIRPTLSNGDVTITGEWLQILTYALHLWPLNSEGSLTCNTYCDTKHPFIMVMTLIPIAECLLLDFINMYYHIIFIINLIYIFDKLKWMSMFHCCLFVFFCSTQIKNVKGLYSAQPWPLCSKGSWAYHT